MKPIEHIILGIALLCLLVLYPSKSQSPMVYAEAENTHITAGNVVVDPAASGGKYIYFSDFTTTLSRVPVRIPWYGNTYIWVHTRGIGSFAFYLKNHEQRINENDIVRTVREPWHWECVTTIKNTDPNAQFIIEYGMTTRNIGIDTFVFTNDPAAIPSMY